MARFPALSRSPGLLSVAALALLGGALSLPASSALPASAASTAAVSSAAADSSGASVVTRTHAVSVGESSPATSPAPPASATAHRRQLPVLRPRTSAAALRTANGSGTPQATSAGTAGPALLQNFDGVDAIDNKRAAGSDLEPPDEGLGAGNGYVANFVNVTGMILNTTGRVLVGPFYLNTFFHEAASANTSDPRVFYDASSQRWFATILVYSFTEQGQVSGSHLDIATSRRNDPRGAWRVVRINTANLNHANCPCLADYPILGIDRDNVYVTTNEFTKTLDGFNGAQLYAISKRQLKEGASAPNVVFYGNLHVAGTLAYHVQVANTYGNPGVEYALSSLDPNGTYDNRIAVWALTDTAAVSRGGTPQLSVRVVSSEAYAPPPDAQTPPGRCTGSLCGPDGAPTSGVVAADFDAMQETQYINGVVVGALNTAVNIPGDSGSRAGVAWFVVRPQLSGGAVAAGTKVIRQGYVAQQGQYLLYPHINMTPNGAMAMTFGFGGPGTYLSAEYATAPSGGRFGAVRRAAAGVAPDNGFTATNKYGSVGRWGDYSNGQIVPGTNRVWLATQYIPNTGTGNANWGNRIFELELG